jgi:hypothetical protein
VEAETTPHRKLETAKAVQIGADPSIYKGIQAAIRLLHSLLNNKNELQMQVQVITGARGC